jgi:hypothetical protein
MSGDLSPDVNAVDAEIASIQGQMKADFRGYERDAALQDRYRTLLEAQKAGGGSAPSPAASNRKREIQAMMGGGTSSPYWHSPELQAEYRALIEAEDADEIPERGESPAGNIEVARANVSALGADDWARSPSFAREVEVGEGVRLDILDATGNDPGLKSAFDGLPRRAQAALYREIGNAYVPRTAPADARTLADFAGRPEGKILAGQWGADAGHKLGRVLARWNRAVGGLSDAEFQQVDSFWRHRLRPDVKAAILNRLAL